MKSETPGASTSAAEITNISQHGFWMLIEGHEFFVPFRDFPWFKDAPVSALLKVELPHAGHVYWPALDIDLAVESIKHPERFPLVSKAETSASKAK